MWLSVDEQSFAAVEQKFSAIFGSAWEEDTCSAEVPCYLELKLKPKA